MIDLELPLVGDMAVFIGAALAIGVAGSRLAECADRLADRTGMGEALTGTLFLGLTTALPGMTASVLAAMEGYAGLAMSNAIGGIAFQTTVLAVADIAYHEANLEHAAASAENMMQTIMLILLLTVVLGGLSGPEVTIGHVHPATIVLICAAGMAFRLVYEVRERPMWKPERTSETVEDVPAPGSHQEKLLRLSVRFAGTAAMTVAAGALIADAAGEIVDETHMPEVVVGGLFMAAATSLPELVTCLAAVRRGALTLAVSDIVGGNFFDVLFVAAADIAFLKGSLYHGTGLGRNDVFMVCLTLLLNVVLLSGLIYRQKHGPGNIGFESVLMLLLYVVGSLIIGLAM